MTKKTMFEFCKENGIATMPILIKFKNKKNKKGEQEYLENGEKKKQKIICCGAKMNWFKNEENGLDKIQKRWDSYNNGNVKGYNMFAWDTGGDFKAIDIDCILPETVDGEINPFITLQDVLPYKKSTTKSFGKHLIAKIPEVTGIGNRCEFPKKYGVDAKGKRGVELLNGQWAWCHFEAKLKFWERTVEVLKQLLDVKAALKEQETPEQTIVNEVKEFNLGSVQDKYKKLQANIVKYQTESNPSDDLSKSVGLILTCACSQDEAVYQIVRDVLRQGSNYSSDEWIRKVWDGFNPIKDDIKYRKRYERYVDAKKVVPNFRIKFTQQTVAKQLINIVKNDFMKLKSAKDDGFYWFNEKNKMWEKCKGKSSVLARIAFKIEIIEKIYRDIYLDMVARDDDNATPFEVNVDKLFGSSGSMEGICKITFNYLLKLLEDSKIDFNQEDTTAHYFQFRNGAFNFKTGLLEERTRDMYITECLDYDYQPLDDQMQQKINQIEEDYKMVLPQEGALENHKVWRAVSFLGIPAESFMLNIGYSAGNGKSTFPENFETAFPIYCRKMSNNLFALGNKDAIRKQLPQLWMRATRMVYMEEWGESNMDVPFFKSVISADTLEITPLYEEGKTMKLTVTFEAQSNGEPNLGEIDPAVARRGVCLKYTQEFRDEGKQFTDATFEPDGITKFRSKGRSQKSKFKKPEWALALFHYYLPSVIKLANSQDMTPVFSKEMSAVFSEMLEGNAKFTGMFAECVTKSETKHIYKKELIKRVSEYLGKPVEWRIIKAEFLKRGYIYNSEHAQGTKSKGTLRKGWMMNCDFISQVYCAIDDMSEDELDM